MTFTLKSMAIAIATPALPHPTMAILTGYPSQECSDGLLVKRKVAVLPQDLTAFLLGSLMIISFFKLRILFSTVILQHTQKNKNTSEVCPELLMPFK